MDLLSITRQLCQKYGIKPARSRGQNFLIEGGVYDEAVACADLDKSDVVLEVGPGLGFLTERLAAKAGKVITVELDDKLAAVLQKRLAEKGIGNVKVLNEDVLKISNFQFLISNQTPNTKCQALNKSQIANYKIVANLPYNITSIFLRKILSLENKPELMALMLQKEVAERIAARPPKMSLLAASVQFYAEPEIIKIVPAEDFWPQPKVDSAIIKLKIKSEKLKVDEKKFFRLVKIGFSSRRKMLKNNLAAGYHIPQAEAENLIKTAGFNPKIRAQELLVKDWIVLFETLGRFVV